MKSVIKSVMVQFESHENRCLFVVYPYNGILSAVKTKEIPMESHGNLDKSQNNYTE